MVSDELIPSVPWRSEGLHLRSSFRQIMVICWHNESEQAFFQRRILTADDHDLYPWKTSHHRWRKETPLPVNSVSPGISSGLVARC
jgi:hypothetical protein